MQSQRRVKPLPKDSVLQLLRKCVGDKKFNSKSEKHKRFPTTVLAGPISGGEKLIARYVLIDHPFGMIEARDGLGVCLVKQAC